MTWDVKEIQTCLTSCTRLVAEREAESSSPAGALVPTKQAVLLPLQTRGTYFGAKVSVCMQLHEVTLYFLGLQFHLVCQS